MNNPSSAINELLTLIETRGPISPNRLVEIMGIARQTVDKYIRRSHKAHLIYLAGFEPSPFGNNRSVKLWAYGCNEDAKRAYVKTPPKKRRPKGTPKSIEMIKALSVRKQRALEEANRLPSRDPFTMALLGIKRDCIPVSLSAPGRMIKHLYDDESVEELLELEITVGCARMFTEFTAEAIMAAMQLGREYRTGLIAQSLGAKNVDVRAMLDRLVDEARLSRRYDETAHEYRFHLTSGQTNQVAGRRSLGDVLSRVMTGYEDEMRARASLCMAIRRDV